MCSYVSRLESSTKAHYFFTSLMFLRSLYDEKLLVYNFGIMKWTWDNTTVQQKLATENVATILANKLRRHSSRTQNVVKVASILGSKFSLSVVSTVLNNLPQAELKRLSSTLETDNDSDDDDPSTSILNSSFRELESEGLWEKKCDDWWQFGHDKIQAAAHDLISDEKKDSFRGKIGLILLDKLDETTLESNLFEVVSLCNCAMSSISGEEKRRVLANLNLRAGMKVSDLTMPRHSQLSLLTHLVFCFSSNINRHWIMPRLILQLLISRQVESSLAQTAGVQILPPCFYYIAREQTPGKSALVLFYV